MSISEALMLLALLPIPLVLAAVLGKADRPWWWAAAAGITLFHIAAIAPAPEPGQPRVAGDDVLFLAICSTVITGVAALGYWAWRGSSRLARRRRATSPISTR
jgi:uncharacterized membrane protein